MASNGEKLAFSTGVDIFSIPSTLNCTGTVSAINHCYVGTRNDVAYGTDYLVFTLLILKQTGLNFTLTDIIDVRSTPMDQKCMDATLLRGTLRFCCDSMPLGALDQFTLPSQNFAFGTVPVLSPVVQLKYYTKFFPEFQVEKHTFPTSELGVLAIGETFTLNNTNRKTDAALRLLQFVISKCFK